MSVDRSVGLAQDGTGKKVRNLEVTVLEYDPLTGTSAAVAMQMQVVAIADPTTGRLLSLDNTDSLLLRVIERLDTVIESLEDLK